MKLQIQKLSEKAVIPETAYDEGDAGVDLASAEDLTLMEGERTLVSTGIAIAIPAGYGGFLLPRSGLAAKHGITLTNSPGLIDSNYRGEIKVILQNTGHEDFEIKTGDRIAQLVVMPVEQVEFEEVVDLPASGRGDGGFGSSG